jgi:iron complex outermembrane receptor protein
LPSSSTLAGRCQRRPPACAGRHRAGEVEKVAPPQTIESIDQQRVREATSTLDAGDAIKYRPCTFVRKRNDGDMQPTIQTRTWGINSGVRSLVYVDDIPISALISNNTTGAPR